MKATFDHSAYYRSHGHNPRGEGVWVFEGVAWNGSGYTHLAKFEINAKFNEAKNEARRWFLSEARCIGQADSVTIFVQP